MWSGRCKNGKRGWVAEKEIDGGERRKTGEREEQENEGGGKKVGNQMRRGETQKWSERAAISRPYLVIMSLCFKVQSVPVMLLHNCASGEFPHRSDDKRTPASSVRGAPTHSLCDTFQSVTNHIWDLCFHFVWINTQLLTGGPRGEAFRCGETKPAERIR